MSCAARWLLVLLDREQDLLAHSMSPRPVRGRRCTFFLKLASRKGCRAANLTGFSGFLAALLSLARHPAVDRQGRMVGACVVTRPESSQARAGRLGARVAGPTVQTGPSFLGQSGLWLLGACVLPS